MSDLRGLKCITFLRMRGGEFIIDRLISIRGVFLFNIGLCDFVCVCVFVCEFFFRFKLSFNVQFLPYVHILITFYFDSDNLTDQFTCIYILFIIQIILQNVWKCWNVHFFLQSTVRVGEMYVCMCWFVMDFAFLEQFFFSFTCILNIFFSINLIIFIRLRFWND